MARWAKALSGTHWPATEGRHTIYELRLEVARLLFADFDRSLHRICRSRSCSRLNLIALSINTFRTTC